MSVRHLFLAACALSFAACNGPKDTCEGSYNSYYSMLKGHDFEGIHEMLTPEFRQKYSPVEKYVKWMDGYWGPTKDFSLRVGQINESGSTCLANGELNYIYRKRGENPVEHSGEYFSWVFKKQPDGKWYIEQPGQEKLSGY